MFLKIRKCYNEIKEESQGGKNHEGLTNNFSRAAGADPSERMQPEGRTDQAGEAAVIEGKLSDGTTYEASVRLTGYLNPLQIKTLQNYGMYVGAETIGAVQFEVQLNQLQGQETLDMTEIWQAAYQETAEEETEELETLAIPAGEWLKR